MPEQRRESGCREAAGLSRAALPGWQGLGTLWMVSLWPPELAEGRWGRRGGLGAEAAERCPLGSAVTAWERREKGEWARGHMGVTTSSLNQHPVGGQV